jgi:hypothetical protein
MHAIRGISIRMVAIPLIALAAQAAAYLLAYAHAHRAPDLVEVTALAVISAVTAALVLGATPRKAV